MHGVGTQRRIPAMRTITSQKYERQTDVQIAANINRLAMEELLFQAEKRARFRDRHPLLARHDWILPMIIGFAALGAGAAFAFAILKLVSH